MPRWLGSLGRITTAGRTYIPQIDGLRFIAIAAVIAFHVREICLFHFGVTVGGGKPPTDIIDSLFGAGHLGVQLFFTISGFVLALPFAKRYLSDGQHVSIRAYYLRRVTRLEPPYIIHLASLFLLCWIVLRRMPSHPGLYQNPAWYHYALNRLIPSLFYSYGFVYATHPYPNIVLWSLETEVQFYILAPLLAHLFLLQSFRNRCFLIILLTGSSSVASEVLPQVFLHRFLLLGNLQFFLPGFLLADCYVNGRIAKSTGKLGGFIWDLGSLSAFALAFVAYKNPYSRLLMPWFMFVICLAGFKGTLCSKALSSPWITTIGGMCYTIYMYHWFMISGLVRLTGHLQTHVIWLDILVQFVVMSILIIAICSVLFAFFERPFMQRDWHLKLWRRFVMRSQPTTAAGGCSEQ